MSKKIIPLILFCCCHFMVNAQTMPVTFLPTIDGDTIQLSQLQGKKIIFVVLPVRHGPQDSTWLLNLDKVYRQHQASIAVIAVPSFEDGYVEAQQADVKNWYRNPLNLSYVITTGMYTRSSSGRQQSALFQWLTNETLNGHFRTDINGYGQIFVLNRAGELKAVFDASTQLTKKMIDIIKGMQ